MLFLLEGMDKTGKSTTTELLRRKFKADFTHMSAPSKWHTEESYFAECLHIIALTAGKNIVFDRSWYGELIWPEIYGRKALLTEQKVQALTKVARLLHPDGVKLIYMHDDNKEAHLARLASFKEPVYKYDEAINKHDEIANRNGFEFVTYPEAVKLWT